MFSYFGAKHRVARLYRPPLFDTIVEPFAGAAGYACYWLEQRAASRAILYDSDPRIVDTWNRILGSTPEQIAAWPMPVEGRMSDDLAVVGRGGYSVLASDNPNVISSRMVERFKPARSRMARMRASVGDRIEIRQGDYRDAPDMEATWFIDPPYQHHGSRYYHGSSGIDYPRLAEWAQSRTGQVIVCEASPADWLPFVPFVTQQSLTGAVMTELIWESDPKPTLFDKPR